jgi:hypothetical protein
MANRSTVILATILGVTVAVAAGLSYQLTTGEIGNTLNRVAISEGGVLVKFAGGSIDGEELETLFGPSKLSNAVSPEGYCNLVIRAGARVKEGREYPNLFLLERYLMNGAAFQKIPDSEDSDLNFADKDYCFWSAMFRGNDCLKIADSSYFVGSSMEQLVRHEKRNRFLRVKSKKVKKEDPDQVPISDTLADPDSEVFLPVEWMGRNDLNYAKADKNLKPKKRGE